MLSFSEERCGAVGNQNRRKNPPLNSKLPGRAPSRRKHEKNMAVMANDD